MAGCSSSCEPPAGPLLYVPLTRFFFRGSGVRGFGCLGEVSQLFSFGFLFRQGPQVGSSRCHKISLDIVHVDIADHPVVALTDVRPQRAIPMASALSEVMLPDEHTIASIRAGIE